MMPRLRFSLRTLLVVVAVCGGSLGWLIPQMRIIRERQVFRAKTIYSGPYDSTTIDAPHVPFYRLWLGDEEVRKIIVAEEEIDAAARLFPEATMIMPPLPPNFKLRDQNTWPKYLRDHVTKKRSATP
jgi:hypothetical protein